MFNHHIPFKFTFSYYIREPDDIREPGIIEDIEKGDLISIAAGQVNFGIRVAKKNRKKILCIGDKLNQDQVQGTDLCRERKPYQPHVELADGLESITNKVLDVIRDNLIQGVSIYNIDHGLVQNTERTKTYLFSKKYIREI